MRPLCAMLLLVASMAITGSNVPIAKVIVAEIPAETLLVLRFAIAALVLIPIAQAERGPSLWSLSARQWAFVSLLAVVGSVLFSVFILEGVKRTSGTSAGIILATLPAVAALFGVAMGERLGRAQTSMIALAVAGTALINVSPGSARSGDTIVGNLLIVGAVVCEAAFVVAARRIGAQIPPFRLSLAVAVVSLATCVLFTAVFGGGMGWPKASASAWVLLVWYALGASVVCTAMWYFGAPHVPAWAGGLATAAVPVAAIAVSALWLGETVTGWQAGGAALVVAAIAAGTLLQRSTRDAHKARCSPSRM